MAAADIIIYAQPITKTCEELGRCWVDTSRTVSFRKTVTTKEEGEAFYAEAFAAAEKLGGQWGLKTLVRKPAEGRRPAKLRLPAFARVGV